MGGNNSPFCISRLLLCHQSQEIYTGTQGQSFVIPHDHLVCFHYHCGNDLGYSRNNMDDRATGTSTSNKQIIPMAELGMDLFIRSVDRIIWGLLFSCPTIRSQTWKNPLERICHPSHCGYHHWLAILSLDGSGAYFAPFAVGISRVPSGSCVNGDARFRSRGPGRTKKETQRVPLLYVGNSISHDFSRWARLEEI